MPHTAAAAAVLGPVLRVTEEVYGKLPLDEQTAGGRVPQAYDRTPRYLWTDAFGVCNFLTLHARTGEKRFLACAEALVRAVHDTLGKTRDGSRRLEPATDEDPTLGGLRIGKRHPEEHADGDGQYFHYLTKWAFALQRMSAVTKDLRYLKWAACMAKNIFPKFVRTEARQLKMYWKMDIKLLRQLVPSEGNLDPFDGLVTYRILQNSIFAAQGVQGAPDLSDEVATFERMVEAKYRSYKSHDPLDLGEALWLAHFEIEKPWARHIAHESFRSIDMLFRAGYFQHDENLRLAFREFGTTLGLQSLLALDGDHESVSSVLSACSVDANEWTKRINYVHDFWERSGLFGRDRDITPVMFCASLAPGSFLRMFPAPTGYPSLSQP